MNNLAQKLLKLRKHYNYSQRFVADVLNVDVLEYMGYENGRSVMDFAKLKTLAKFYHISVIELFDNNMEVTIHDISNTHTDEVNIEYFLPPKSKSEKIKEWLIKNRLFVIASCVVAIIFIAILLFIPRQEVSNLSLTMVDKNRLDSIRLEEYVVGVVGGEMPVSFDIEALKAQAVASRSYALKKINDNKNGSYDVLDTTSNQVYLDDDDLKEKWGSKYVSYINKVREAVNETSMEYLEYNGEVANTMFFSTSNGYTEDSQVVFSEDVPYLQSVDSSWDEKVSSTFNYTSKFSLDEVLSKLGLDDSDKLEVEVLERSSSNRIISLKINGVKFTGRDVYTKLKIRSTDFSMVQDGDEVIIKTKGYGHGVGMSQYGAYGMAKAGYKYDEILAHYYTGTKLKKIEN